MSTIHAQHRSAKRQPSSRRGSSTADDSGPKPTPRTDSLGGFYAAGPAVALGGAVQRKVAVGKAGDRYEREADSVAERVDRGQTAPQISTLPPGGLGTAQRMGGEDESAQSKDEEPETSPAQAKSEEPETEPAQSKQEEPAQAKQEEPAQVKEGEPAQSKEEEPETEPAQSKQEGPAQSKEEEPAQSMDEEPAQSKDEESAQSTEEEPAQSMEEEPAQSKDEEPAQSMEEEPAQSMEEEPAQSKEEEPAQSKDEEPGRRRSRPPGPGPDGRKRKPSQARPSTPGARASLWTRAYAAPLGAGPGRRPGQRADPPRRPRPGGRQGHEGAGLYPQERHLARSGTVAEGHQADGARGHPRGAAGRRRPEQAKGSEGRGRTRVARRGEGGRPAGSRSWCRRHRRFRRPGGCGRNVWKRRVGRRRFTRWR